MTGIQQIITVGLVVLGTQLTRWLPFFILNSNKRTPAYVQYIGKVLPPAIFGMLVVYCFRELEYSGCNTWSTGNRIGMLRYRLAIVI